jgi:hypothetical protein
MKENSITAGIMVIILSIGCAPVGTTQKTGGTQRSAIQTLAEHSRLKPDSGVCAIERSIVDAVRAEGVGDRFCLQAVPFTARNLLGIYRLPDGLSFASANASVPSTDQQPASVALFDHAEIHKEFAWVGDLFPDGGRYGIFPKATAYFFQEYPGDRMPSKRGDYVGWPCTDGSVHRIKGTITTDTCTLINEGAESERLTFAVIQPHGYVYLRGKGKVILPDGREVALGYDEGANQLRSTQTPQQPSDQGASQMGMPGRTGSQAGMQGDRNQQLERQVASQLRAQGLGQQGQLLILAVGTRVILLGEVPSQNEKQQVEQITDQVQGVGQVDNRIVVLSQAQRESDGQLQQAVQQQLNRVLPVGLKNL